MTAQATPQFSDTIQNSSRPDLNDLQRVAFKWWENGFQPVPLLHGEKRPKYDRWQHAVPTPETIERDFAPRSNIGLMCGVLTPDSTALLTIDIDINDRGLIGYAERQIGGPSFKKIGKKGISITVRSPASIKSQKIDMYKGGNHSPCIDILGSGKMTVCPPSIHPDTKEPYRWVSKENPSNTRFEELTLIDHTVVDKLRAYCKNRDNPVAYLDDMLWRGVNGGGDTHDTCVAAVGCMVSWGWSDEEVHREIHFAKKGACERAGETYDWSSERKVVQEWIDSARTKGFDQSKKKAKPSHGDLATLVLSKHGSAIRRDKTRRDWLVYNGRYWVDGATEEVKTLIRRSLTEDQVFRSVIDGVEAVMRYDASLGLTIDAWNRDKHYLNCPDGTYNLMTRERLPHDPAHHITRMTRVSPRFDYQDSLWVKAINTWFGDDAVEIEYIQMLFGLFLSGETRDECVAMWIGKSGAGKSKMTDAMGYVMGDYAQTATDTAFLDVRYHPHLEEVARMRGKRLVFVHEVEGYLNLRRVKSIASGEATSASFKGKDSFEFQPEAKIWFVGNEAPPTRSSGRELQRRFHVYEFVRQIEAKDMDINLGAKLREEAEFILGWAIDGAVKYYQKGRLDRSPHVIDSSNRYFADADILEQWIEDRCVIDGNAVAAVADLFDSHSAWAEEARVKATLDKGRFSQRLKAKGYQLERRTLFTGKPAVRVIAGLRLRTDDELPMRGIVQEHDRF